MNTTFNLLYVTVTIKILTTALYVSDLSGSLTQSSYPAVPTSTGILNTIISTSYSIEPSKVGTSYGISTLGGTVKPLVTNCIVLFGRWVPGISRCLQCEQPVPRQFNIPMAGNTYNPAIIPYAVLQAFVTLS